jgi:glucose/arabinose dehydrogenase
MTCRRVFRRAAFVLIVTVLLSVGRTDVVVSAGPSEPRPALSLQPILTRGLTRPVYVTHSRDGSGRLFVLEQPGRIRIIKDGVLLDRPFLDITKPVRSTGMEQGLLGLAFHPRFRENGRYVVQYTRQPDGAIVVAEYRSSRDPDVSDMDEKILLAVPHPYTNHNAGMIEFGPDGFLYIGMGDGGSRGDPDNRGQSVAEWLGKLLRIDVDRGTPYAIPPDNPFAGGRGRPEIFAWGLRNPWRFSFDRRTADLWVADVGQNDWEEIDVVARGGNYGWRVMEGRHCFSPKTGCHTDGLIPPVAEYPNRSPRCSVTGGYVYRGRQWPALDGWYIFSDYCSGEILGLSPQDRSTVQVLFQTGMRVASFGEDETGEVYVVDHNGGVYRITEKSVPTRG